MIIGHDGMGLARYFHGQILLAYVRDGAGHIKEHPVLVMDTAEACESGEPLDVLVISTRIDDPCPHFHIRVHDSNRTDPRTGLLEPCVVKCNWSQVVDTRRIIKRWDHSRMLCSMR